MAQNLIWSNFIQNNLLHNAITICLHIYYISHIRKLDLFVQFKKLKVKIFVAKDEKMIADE